MSLSPDSSLVRRTIDLNYANKQRSEALKWILINGVVFLILTYDLCYKCPGYTSVLHYVELCLACGLCASLATHARRLVPARAPPRAVSPRQLQLLGLRPADLDSSLHVSSCEPPSPPAREGTPPPLAARSWRSSPAATPSPPASPTTPTERPPKDEFIADRRALDEFLRHQDSPESAPPAFSQYAVLPPADVYQLAPLLTESSSEAGAGGGERGAAGVWRRLNIEPAHLTHYVFNLRRWIHATIIERLVREISAIDQLLSAAGAEARAGAAPERLRAAAPPALAPRLRTLLPFLSAAADHHYLVDRVTELSRGGCLSAYRWDGGGATWRANRPRDAELLHALLTTYLEVVAPGASARTPRVVAGPGTGSGPPHYIVHTDKGTLDVGGGRNNLFHCVLVWIASARPPALHLGRTGLNMLWIIGR